MAFHSSPCPCLRPPSADAIQDHKKVFLECDQAPGGPASQPSPEVAGGDAAGAGGRGEEGGRRGSVTSVESETSICSMGQLGNTIANSEWAGGGACPVSFIRLQFLPDKFRAGSPVFTALTSHLRVTVFVCPCLQFPAAGGAPRGWITPCTAPTF